MLMISKDMPFTTTHYSRSPPLTSPLLLCSCALNRWCHPAPRHSEHATELSSACAVFWSLVHRQLNENTTYEVGVLVDNIALASKARLLMVCARLSAVGLPLQTVLTFLSGLTGVGALSLFASRLSYFAFLFPVSSKSLGGTITCTFRKPVR